MRPHALRRLQTAARQAPREAIGMNPKRVESNDDVEFDADEIEAAAEERVTPSNPPEVDSQTENLTEWDQPASAAAHSAPKNPIEDETTIAEELVEEGVDEADREQRLASADPDFEP
jgi:hypothetical protein